ncbi:MAG: ParB N-terminal domain-containing protein [Peptostreptococcaceae bacterium]
MSKFNLNTNNDFFKGLTDKVNDVKEKGNFNFQNIDINLIKPSKKNFFEISGIEELAKDIKANGLYHNLVVRKLDDGTYEIISGERRYSALKYNGEKRIPCVVREADELDSEIMLIQANASARELTESEKLKTVERLKELYEEKKKNGVKIGGKVRDKIGEDLGGMSGMQVQRYIKISDELIPELRELFDNQQITLSDSLDFSKMSKDQQLVIYKFLSENINASKEEVKALKENIKSKEEENKTVKKKQYELEKTIQELQTDLDIKEKEVNEKIQHIKTELQEEASKEAELKSQSKIDELNTRLSILENEKQSINYEYEKMKKEKDSEIEELTSKKNEIDNNSEILKLNVEYSVILKNVESITKEAIDCHKKLTNPSSENKIKLKELKKNISEMLDLISKIDN